MSKVKVKDVPNVAFRLFSRVDSQKLQPKSIYDSCEVPEGDRATFVIKPANPAQKDLLREVQASIEMAQKAVADEYGIGYEEELQMIEIASKMRSAVGEDGLLDSDKLAEVETTAGDIKAMELFGQMNSKKEMVKTIIICNEDTRNILAECVQDLTNYKELLFDDELKDYVLRLTEKSVHDAVLDMPDAFLGWLYDVILHASRLKNDEALGV